MYRKETVEVLGKPMPVLLFDPPGEGPHPGLVIAQHLPVSHAGLEVDPYQVDVGERYAAAGYACVMPWLFHWWPAEDTMESKRDAFRDDWTLADLAAALDLLSAQPGVDATRVGILGHCWGGRVAWLGACHERRYRACAVFYGGRIKVPLADGGPAPISLAGGMRGAVLGIFGNEDQNPSPADVDDYDAALTAAGVSHEFHRYDGAGHGFQTWSMPERYRKEQSEDAWARALDFFGRYLGHPG